MMHERPKEKAQAGCKGLVKSDRDSVGQKRSYFKPLVLAGVAPPLPCRSLRIHVLLTERYSR